MVNVGAQLVKTAWAHEEAFAPFGPLPFEELFDSSSPPKVASKTNDVAGDGTTTATVLARANLIVAEFKRSSLLILLFCSFQNFSLNSRLLGEGSNK